MTDYEKLIEALQREHDAEDRRHHELLDALRQERGKRPSHLSTYLQICAGLAQNDRRVEQSGAKTPREQRRVRQTDEPGRADHR